MAENITPGVSEPSISSDADRSVETKKQPKIIVQGGAFCPHGEINQKEDFLDGVKASAKAGYEILGRGGTAVDAVEAAVNVLENNGLFNAGYGSFLNNDGEVECDAMIMNGFNLDTGAVMNGRYFPNPVSLAKKVMNESWHCALSGDGAKEFAIKKELPLCNPETLISERARQITVENKDYMKFVLSHYPGNLVDCDTVSAVAMDGAGRLACATSSGGIAGKLKGRVGDAALVGCGGYANKRGAATVSGHGESIMKITLAREVVSMMENGRSAQISAEKSLENLGDQCGKCGAGGVIAIDEHGNLGKAFTTKAMPWASIVGTQMEFGMEGNERRTSPVIWD